MAGCEQIGQEIVQSRAQVAAALSHEREALRREVGHRTGRFGRRERDHALDAIHCRQRVEAIAQEAVVESRGQRGAEGGMQSRFHGGRAGNLRHHRHGRFAAWRHRLHRTPHPTQGSGGASVWIAWRKSW